MCLRVAGTNSICAEKQRRNEEKMKLSISNIAWTPELDTEVYHMMQRIGFSGLEIAPTRIFPENPYGDLHRARQWKKDMEEQYGFRIPSMQSIWFGRQEKLFGSGKEREALLQYTFRAIEFAEATGCGNLVFGCPKNRNLPEGADESEALPFWKQIGEYAAKKGTVIAMEANPPIYGTNYINGTKEALALVERVDLPGFLLNLDVGTMIENKEDVSLLAGKVSFINHVHISEPGLSPIKKRGLHSELADCLKEEGYGGFVSVEMGKGADMDTLEEIMRYVKEIFG